MSILEKLMLGAGAVAVCFSCTASFADTRLSRITRDDDAGSAREQKSIRGFQVGPDHQDERIDGLGRRSIRARLHSFDPSEYIVAQPSSPHQLLLANMRLIKSAVDAYAAASSGSYPTKLDKRFKQILNCYSNISQGGPLENPVTHKFEWPTIRRVENVAFLANTTDPIGVGKIQYSVVIDKYGKSVGYGIRAGNLVNGQPLSLGPSKAMVLSNQ